MKKLSNGMIILKMVQFARVKVKSSLQIPIYRVDLIENINIKRNK